jgi:hypothetical protein
MSIIRSLFDAMGRGMKRHLIIAALAALCALLSSCDKCTGELQELRVPGAPKSCSDHLQR